MLSFALPVLLAAATLGPLATVAQSSSNNSNETATLPAIYYLQFILANSLKIGDSCSWSDETFRQAGTRAMERYPKESKLYDQVFDRIVTSTVENDRTYCLASELLVCDKNTARCVCGESSAQATLGVKYKPTDYESELDVNTGKKVCRYSQGAACSPPSATKNAGSFVPKCAQGLSCTYVKDGTTCTTSSTFKYVLDSIRKNMTREEMLEGIMTGKMCQCVNEDNNLTDNAKSNKWNGRFKRSVGGEGDIHARAKAALLSPGVLDM